MEGKTLKEMEWGNLWRCGFRENRCRNWKPWIGGGGGFNNKIKDWNELVWIDDCQVFVLLFINIVTRVSTYLYSIYFVKFI